MIKGICIMLDTFPRFAAHPLRLPMPVADKFLPRFVMAGAYALYPIFLCQLLIKARFQDCYLYLYYKCESRFKSKRRG